MALVPTVGRVWSEVWRRYGRARGVSSPLRHAARWPEARCTCSCPLTAIGPGILLKRSTSPLTSRSQRSFEWPVALLCSRSVRAPESPRVALPVWAACPNCARQTLGDQLHISWHIKECVRPGLEAVCGDESTAQARLNIYGAYICSSVVFFWRLGCLLWKLYTCFCYVYSYFPQNIQMYIKNKSLDYNLKINLMKVF